MEEPRSQISAFANDAPILSLPVTHRRRGSSNAESALSPVQIC